MNENNENKNLPDDVGDGASTEAFKADFNDVEVEFSNAEVELSDSGEDSTAEEATDATEIAGPCNTADETAESTETKHKARRSGRKISTKALIRESNLALCLSAISIVLLAVIAVLLTTGILPAGTRMVYVSVSNSGSDGSQGGSTSLGSDGSQNNWASSETLEEFKKSVVIIDISKAQGSGSGSGIVLSSDGFIVTNYHVIEGASNIAVTFYGEKQKKLATVVGYSERDDIAVIKVEAKNLSPAVFANSANCRVGDRVYAVGAPEGADFGWTITSGIISDPLRELKIYTSDYVLEKKMYVLQTDAPVNPGNSGGPLINARGEVVGIITMKRSNSAGLGFALPSSASLEIIEAIIEKGSADSIVSGISKGRPLIGIVGVGLEAGVWYEFTDEEVRAVTDVYAMAHPDTCIKISVSGVYITSLNSNLDASKQLLAGDVITHINNVKVTTTYDIMDIINEFNGGDKVSITFVRDGKTKTVSITLGTEQ